MLHRTAWLIRDTRATGSVRFGRELAAGLIEPLAGIARLASGDAGRVVDKPPHLVPDAVEATLMAGVAWQGATVDDFEPDATPFAELNLRYGDPRTSRSRTPSGASSSGRSPSGTPSRSARPSSTSTAGRISQPVTPTVIASPSSASTSRRPPLLGRPVGMRHVRGRRRVPTRGRRVVQRRRAREPAARRRHRVDLGPGHCRHRRADHDELHPRRRAMPPLG